MDIRRMEMKRCISMGSYENADEPAKKKLPLKLFIGDLNTTWSPSFTENYIRQLCPEASHIIVYSKVGDPDHSRGFAFAQFIDHTVASQAFQRNVQKGIRVAWATPEHEASPEVMKQVRNLYVRNVASSVSEEQLKEAFGGEEAGVERVKIQMDYSFIHFKTREQAEIKLNQWNGKELMGRRLEVVWAKPPPVDRNRSIIPINDHSIIPSYLFNNMRPCLPTLPMTSSNIGLSSMDQLIRPMDSTSSSGIPHLPPISIQSTQWPSTYIPFYLTQRNDNIFNQNGYKQLLMTRCLYANLPAPIYHVEIIGQTIDANNRTSEIYKTIVIVVGHRLEGTPSVSKEMADESAALAGYRLIISMGH